MASLSDGKKDLAEHGIFLLTGDVEDGKCEEAIRFILEANLNSRHEYLTLVVNSPGGYVNAGFSLIDVMNGSKLEIRTVGLGILASMGLLIFIAGQKGKRALTPNTMVMSHQWSGLRWGKEHELVASQRGDDLLTGMITRHLRRHTGLKEKEIRKYLLPPSDVWLSARDARRLGLCDEVKEY
jgi:ATP-dependent Clp protease, protease subunit